MQNGEMMTIYLTDKEVKKLLPMDVCISLVESVFQSEYAGHAETLPRKRIVLEKGMFHVMGGASFGVGAVGLKTYATTSEGTKFFVYLFDAVNGSLLAIIEGGELSRIRTGAATGVAAKYLSEKKESVLGIIGAGYQAEPQIEAVLKVRNISKINVYSRNERKRNEFVSRVSSKFNVKLKASDNVKSCVSDSDIVITVTNSSEPVFDSKWLKPNVFVSAVGSNHWQRRELDQMTIEEAGFIVVDNLEQAKEECGDLIWAASKGKFRWNTVVELKDIVTKNRTIPNGNGLVLFESQGAGIEDITSAMWVYNAASELGLGKKLPFGKD